VVRFECRGVVRNITEEDVRVLDVEHEVVEVGDGLSE
jgi:hypothetical protein